MAILAAILGILLVAVVLWDGFETIVLPRRVTRKLRLTRLFYRFTWRVWRSMGRAIVSGRRLETILSYFGPLSLILLLSLWASGLVTGFALLLLACGTRSMPLGPDLLTNLYLSGTTFFTLGLGD